MSRGGGDAQYLPELNAAKAGHLERLALQKGYIVEHGGSVHAYIEFDQTVGYNNGRATTWIRAELTNNRTNIHGHPFDPANLPEGAR